MRTLRCARLFCLLAVSVLLVACSNGRGSLDEPESPPAQGGGEGFSIGGAVTGLVGSGLVLQNNGGGNLTIAADGAFTFTGRLANGASYNVAVLSQPTAPAQACTVADGSGSVSGANVTNIAVTCATGQFSVGGSVSGLAGSGLVLQNSGGDDLPISANGNFTFGSRLVNGATYNVTVRAQPGGQNCIVRNGAGTISGASVSNIDVSCASNQFSIGGSVTGLAGSGLVLQLSRANDLSIVSNGSFAFGIGVPNGSQYEITVRTQPRNPTQVCTVTNGTGTVAGSNITNVAISCVSSRFSVGGTVSGLAGTGLVLELNGANDLEIASNGSFTFGAPLTSGTQYRVTVRTQPSNPAQVCTVASGNGTVGSTNVTSIRVTCASDTHSVGGSVNGLLGSGLQLQNNGGDTITITSNGSFTFPTELATGASYNVTVRTQPSSPDQACTVTNGRGTVANLDVSSVVVSCNTSDFTIGGAVVDLEGSGLVLRNNGADELRIDSSGSFTFDTALPTGASYNVTVAEQPRNPEQTCTVSSGSGIVGSSNITTITVRCSSPPSGNKFEVGGHVSELRGSGLILQNNGGDDLAIASNGSFEFATRLPGGAFYNVTVLRQPSNPAQSCNVQNASGVIGNSKIMNVEVKCRGGDD